MRPLAGIRIIDLTRVISGPFCTRLLHQLGAEVIKVDNPMGGDDARAFAPFRSDGRSVFFCLLNSGKQSVARDLKSERGRQILMRLVRRADVLIDNLAPGTFERLQLRRDDMESENPGLIQPSISGSALAPRSRAARPTMRRSRPSPASCRRRDSLRAIPCCSARRSRTRSRSTPSSPSRRL